MIKKKHFEPYSKDEIVSVLVKYQFDYPSHGILNDLERCKEYNEETTLEKNNKDYAVLLDRYIELRNELFFKYDTYDREIYTKNDFLKLMKFERELREWD